METDVRNISIIRTMDKKIVFIPLQCDLHSRFLNISLLCVSHCSGRFSFSIYTPVNHRLLFIAIENVVRDDRKGSERLVACHCRSIEGLLLCS